MMKAGRVVPKGGTTLRYPLGVPRRSELLRPLAGAMEDAEDFDGVAAHAVGDQVRGIGDDQLAGACDAPGAAHAGMLGEQLDGAGNGVEEALSGFGTVASDVVGLHFQTGAGALRPADLQRPGRAISGHGRLVSGGDTSSTPG